MALKESYTGNFLNLTRVNYKKSTTNTIHDGERADAFTLRLGNRQGYPFLPLLLNTVRETGKLGKRKKQRHLS